eukprot:2640874-Pyramimonas_sp.AAC.1
MQEAVVYTAAGVEAVRLEPPSPSPPLTSEAWFVPAAAAAGLVALVCCSCLWCFVQVSAPYQTPY